MAIYHCSISNVSRGKGSSSTAALAYITGRPVHDERTGQTYDYGHKERIVATGTMIPDGVPASFAWAPTLFNSIELYERSSTARTAKKIVVALPRELSPEQRRELVEEFIRREITSKGYAATYAIHTDKDDNNPHAHILIANRRLIETGWIETKRKMEYKLDKDGNRLPVIDPATGAQKVDGRGRKQWQRCSVDQNPLDKREVLKEIRAAWARECNARLDPGHQIDHRSNKERGIQEEPTIHEGYAAHRLEAAGGQSDRIEINRQIRQRRSLLQLLTEEFQKISQKISELVRGHQQPKEEPGKLPSLADVLQRAQKQSQGSRRPQRDPEKDWELER